MKSVSICAVQHQFTAMIAEVENGAGIVISCHERAVARPAPVSTAASPPVTTPPTASNYWRKHPLAPVVCSSAAHTDHVRRQSWQSMNAIQSRPIGSIVAIFGMTYR
jgi:antitoxin (DNA-binding transcriptional repressor) of toxin-antitoxin stability system